MNKEELTKAQRWAIADKLAEDRLPGINAVLEDVVPSRTLYARFGKRALDIVVSACALIVCLPINIILGVVTYFDVGRPVFFRQERVGRDGKLFTLIKFRNMRNTVDENGELLPASQRVTSFGKFVRRTSLDELWNFWSVFKGDIPSRILKTRRGFSVKKPGAFALPANLARTRIAVSLQVRAAICHIVGVPQNLFEYFIAGYGKVREVFAKLSSRFDFPHLDRSLPVPCDGLFV